MEGPPICNVQAVLEKLTTQTATIVDTALYIFLLNFAGSAYTLLQGYKCIICLIKGHYSLSLKGPILSLFPTLL